MGRQGEARSQYLGMGLCHIVKAVSFLNNDCKLVSAPVTFCLRASDAVPRMKAVSSFAVWAGSQCGRTRPSERASALHAWCSGRRSFTTRGAANMQIHGNVCMAAVAVTDALDWRLHGFDLLSDHAGAADMPLLNASWMVGAQYKPGEVLCVCAPCLSHQFLFKLRRVHRRLCLSLVPVQIGVTSVLNGWITSLR